MDNSNMSNNRVNEHLGVNKLGKGIRKSPFHQPNFSNTTNNNALVTGSVNARQQPQPQVYNISKNDFRNVVQQLTGSPAHDPYPRPPPNNNNNNNRPKPPSMRLQKIRPPPLAPMNRPPPVYYRPAPVPPPMVPAQPRVPLNNFVRQGPYGQLSPTPLTPGNSLWSNSAESPVSAYMRILQHSMVDPSPRQPQLNPQLYPQAHVQGQAQLHSPPYGMLPSPRMNGPTLLPSPTSQFLLPSPGFFNMLSPRSPFPLLSPGLGNQYPHPLTPNLPFSPIGGQMGILGPGPHPPPLSPGFVFPQSPGFFPMPSPRWRDQWS